VLLDAQQNITDDTHIKAVLPTIEYIIQKKGKVVLASHLGRPKGKIGPTLRMIPEENDLHFAEQLAEGIDVYMGIKR